MPVLTGLPPSTGFGIWLAVAESNAVLTAPGPSGTNEVHEMVDAESEAHNDLRVTKNSDTLLSIFSWKFG